MSEKGTKIHINKVRNRIMNLSPTVSTGLERECSREDFFLEEDKAIGKGGFSQVWKVRHKQSDKVYVIKVVNKQNIIQQKMGEQINREVEIMYKINHPHIIKLINHFEDDENLYLIMELGAKGQLFALLNKTHGFEQKRAAQFMREIISAVKYLHSFDPPIIHRDIKPENILLDENNRCKLADFGWSNYAIRDKERQTFCGTPEYLSPEMVNKKGHDTSVDIWALGVLLFELLTGKPPFIGRNTRELFSNIGALKINWAGNDFNPLAKNLIVKILKQNPKERPSLDEILSQPWFEKNQPTIPVMTPLKITYKEYLESHMVCLKTKDTEEEINKFIKDKNNKQLLAIMAIVNRNNSNPSTSINNNNQSNSINNSTSNKDQKDNKEKNENNENNENTQNNNSGNNTNNLSNNTEINIITKEQLQNSVKLLNDIIESQKTLIDDLKQKNNKMVLELNKAKNELSEFKDPKIKTEEQRQIELLNSQIDKYKVASKDRLGLLAEIEEKSNKIIELNSKVKEKDEDIDRLQKMYKTANEKSKGDEATISSLENKISELNKKISDHLKNKEMAVSTVQKKYEILQQKLLDITCSTESSNLHRENLIEIINDSITEFSEIFRYKSEKILSFLKEIKENAVNSDEKFSRIIDDTNRELQKTICNTKKSLEDNYNSLAAVEKEAKSKMQERFDWQNKHINELMQFKIKATNFEVKIESLEAKNKNLEELLEITKKENDILTTSINEKKEIISKLNDKITELEQLNAGLKDFIMSKCSEKLDDYEIFLKNNCY